MRALRLFLVLLAPLLLGARAPTPGDRIDIVVPPEMVDDFIAAHTESPLLERTKPSGLDAAVRPPLDGFESWSSPALLGASASKDRRTWSLHTTPALAPIAQLALGGLIVLAGGYLARRKFSA